MNSSVPGDAYAGSAAVRECAEEVSAFLAIWAVRDDGKPDANARRAANDAMDAIDTALRQLYGLRERLVDDIRASDDAAMARSAELLGGAQ